MGTSEAKKYKLLIIEDDFQNQKFLKLVLRRHFEISICDSSDSCYDFLGRGKFDVILMDITIRGSKNGLELTRELKNTPAYNTIPIICYTGHVYNSDRINALEAGCDVYLSKPSNLQTLISSIMEVLKTRGKEILFDNLVSNVKYA